MTMKTAIGRINGQWTVRPFGGMENIVIATAACGCPACDNGVQSGHFACASPDPLLLQAERDRLIARHYDDGEWRWFVI